MWKAFLRWTISTGIVTINRENYCRLNLGKKSKLLNKLPFRINRKILILLSPSYFTHIKISALALLKMVMHARSGGNLEVMGIMLGKVDGNTMIVMDAFALPVEGTETRVNAQAQAYEYMTDYIDNAKPVKRLENAIGWYHSHPGYGCWLSGIDVSTQMLNQQYQEPFVAIVVGYYSS